MCGVNQPILCSPKYVVLLCKNRTIVELLAYFLYSLLLFLFLNNEHIGISVFLVSTFYNFDILCAFVMLQGARISARK